MKTSSFSIQTGQLESGVVGAVNSLSCSDLKRVTHIAVVVGDIEKALAFWSELLGLEKPSITETESWESTHMAFRGKPSKARARLSFLNLENIVLEFIQPVGRPSTWQNFLDRCGEGIHHIAFSVEDVEKTSESLGKAGVKVEQKGDFKGGRYLYTNPKSKLGAIIELLQMHT
jgi:methylmalonyl-CoA epimerase